MFPNCEARGGNGGTNTRSELAQKLKLHAVGTGSLCGCRGATGEGGGHQKVASSRRNSKDQRERTPGEGTSSHPHGTDTGWAGKSSFRQPRTRALWARRELPG